ncbi:uncharacterized protein LOC129597455 [Paramacrobiotus metropolitanus]|uniref:uncharacterized protein LOC129597455 n=1 Tax=Paramacrobiotus metropolitanus TaxID=2943436 RepID=UPI002445A6B8|nr:uncharacterized protein LOC129597455 [Paramacrobiotus metropolitanus]
MNGSLPLANQSYAANASVAASVSPPIAAFSQLATYGLCRLVQPENASAVNALSCLPWTSYTASVGIFVALFVIGIGQCLVSLVCRYGCMALLNSIGSFLRTTLKQIDWRGLAVFVLSFTSLYFNFFQPYFGSDFVKLSQGWYYKTLPGTRFWIEDDVSINAALLLLLFLNLVNYRPCGITSTTAVESHENGKKEEGCCKEPTCLAERIWSAIRDWECFASVANIPLLYYEIIIIARWPIEPLSYWNVTATSLQFLRIFCFTWLCDEIIRIFRKLPIAAGTVMRRITWIVCSFLSLTAWVQLVETLGDPWLSTYTTPKDLTYGKLVAFLYGKLVFLDLTSGQLETTIGRISVYVAQAVTLIFLAQIIPEMFKQLPKILRIHSFSAVYTRKDTKFILLLGSVNSDAVEKFAERFRSTNPKEKIVVLVDPTTNDAAVEEMHTVAGKHKDRLSVISGSLFENDDLKNQVFDNCQCALFFANENASNFAEEDHCNFLRVNKMKQRHRNTRVIVKILMFENKEKFYHIPFWRDKSDPATKQQADQIICTAEFQFALLAQRYFAPGFPQLINQWFGEEKGPTVKAVTLPVPTAVAAPANTPNNDMRAGSSTSTAPAVNQAESVVNVESNSARNNRRRGSPIAAQPREEVALIVIAPAEPALAPLNATAAPGRTITGNLTYADARRTFERQGTLFAVLQDGEYHLYPQKHLFLQPGAKCFLITNASNSELNSTARRWAMMQNGKASLARAGQNAIVQPNNPVQDDRDARRRIRIALSTDTECVEECGAQNIACDSTGQYWRYQLAKAETSVKLPHELENALPSKLEQHIVICVVSDRDPAPIGLVNFVKPLRAVHINPPVVVILAERDCLAKEWPTLKEFPDILLVQGNPADPSHLRAVNLQDSRICVVVDASELPKKQSEKWKKSDAEAELIWPMLPKHFYRHVNAVLVTAAITEYLKEFRNQTLPEEILTCIHHKAIGLISWDQNDPTCAQKPRVTETCTAPSFIDALMLKCYEDVDIFNLTLLLILGGFKEVSRDFESKDFRGCPFSGNQATLSKLSPVGNVLKKYDPSTGKSTGIPTQNPQQNQDVEIDFNLGNDETSEALCSRLAELGYLVIGNQPISSKRVNSVLAKDNHYFTLEKPFYVKARQELFAHINGGANSRINTSEQLRLLADLEALPTFILKAVEEESKGIPGLTKPDCYPHWLVVYYRIMEKVLRNPDLLQGRGCTTETELPNLIKSLEYHTLTRAEDSTVGEIQKTTWRLPNAILTYVIAVYYHKYAKLKPSVISTIPVDIFFWNVEFPKPRRCLSWEDLTFILK